MTDQITTPDLAKALRQADMLDQGPAHRHFGAADMLRALVAEVQRLNHWADGFTDAHLKERQTGDALVKELRAEVEALRGERLPTPEDINAQRWAGLDGAIAWHLIDRHGENWAHVARLMAAWLDANTEPFRAELEALRRGEFVCTKCGLRKDAEQAGAAPF